MITIDSQAAELKLVADTLFRPAGSPSPAAAPSPGSKAAPPPTDTVVLSPQAKAALAAQSPAPQNATVPAGQAQDGKVIDATTVDPGFEAVAATYSAPDSSYKPKAGDPLSARYYADWNFLDGVNGIAPPGSLNLKYREAFRNKTLVVQDAFTVPGLNLKVDWDIVASPTGIGGSLHESMNFAAIPHAKGTHSFFALDQMGAFIVTYKT